MPLTINGTTHADGAPLTVGGVQVQAVTANGVTVWVNNYIPSAITDFDSTDDEVNQITHTWSNADAVPSATYNIMLASDDSVLAENATSPYVQSWDNNPGTASYYINAINTVGTTKSNVSEGTALNPPYAGPPSPIIITATKTMIAGTDFPADIPISACLVGGGGGGNRHDINFVNVLGGMAGTVASGAAGTFAHGASVVATVGAGGVGRGTHGEIGGAGTASSFGAITGAGSVGGGYAGSSGSITTCGGTNTDGNAIPHIVTFAYGGQSSGFGKGGNGSTGGAPENGGVGSGGGAEGYPYAGPVSGAGGRGQINLSW